MRPTPNFLGLRWQFISVTTTAPLLRILPLWLLAGLEIFLLSAGRNAFGYLGSPLVLLLTGVAIALYPLLAGAHWRLGERERNGQWLAWLVFGGGLVLAILALHPIIRDFAINPNHSDVIPAIQQIYMKRLFAGESIYAPFSDFGWTIYPNYLPLQWLPYIGSYLLHIDPRWWAFGVLVFVLAYRQWQMSREQLPLSHRILRSAAPWLILVPFIHWNHPSMGYGVETLIAGYYLLLTYSFFTRNVYARAGGILVTVLSRFSVLLWLPLYLLSGWREEGTRTAIRISLLVLLGALLIYVLPFLSQDWESFQRGYDYYTAAAPAEWQPRGPENRPIHLYKGAGMAVWFYQLADGPVEERVALAKKFHIALSLLAMAIMTGVYFWRRKHLHFPLFLLLSLKFYLTFFYSFIQVPYTYLFLVPLAVTIAILTRWPLPAAEEAVLKDTV